MKRMRKILKIDEELCDGCGQCVPDCAEGSLRIVDGKARLVADNLCDGLGACLGACPTGALTIIEREADEFDEEAVERYLAQQKTAHLQDETAPATGRCPSTTIRQIVPAGGVNTGQVRGVPALQAGSPLSHWPIQLRLVSPNASFLKDADIVLAADCCLAAVADFHGRYLGDRVLLMGCPKFDDGSFYVQRLAEIIAANTLRSITVLIMEVPCCSAMTSIVDQAMNRAAASVPVEQITIGIDGSRL
jgi:Fe-S-cluster-containing hydrogenase component 2